MSVCVKGIGGPDQKKFFDFDQVFSIVSLLLVIQFLNLYYSIRYSVAEKEILKLTFSKTQNILSCQLWMVTMFAYLPMDKQEQVRCFSI
jgi:hypothetical protein